MDAHETHPKRGNPSGGLVHHLHGALYLWAYKFAMPRARRAVVLVLSYDLAINRCAIAVY